jgi:hypothetical protein
VLALPILLAVAVAAAPAKAPKTGGAAKKTRAPAAGPASPPSPAAPSAAKIDKPAAAAADGASATDLLGQARKAYEQMEYDSAAALSTRALDLPGLDAEARLDAYLIQARSLAITSEPQAAEVPFRLLLRARPDFELPPNTPPKILGVFQKVQSEERAILEQVRSVSRKRLVDGLSLLNEPPAQGRGGKPLAFAFRLRDPTAAVTAFEVPFRRAGESDFSALALKREQDGTWRGALPAEWTASERGFNLEYFLVTRDDSGPLLTRGNAQSPLTLAITAGMVERERFRPLPRWSVWAGVAATAVAALATGGLAMGTRSAQADYDAYATRGLSTTIDGATLNQKAATARGLSNATFGTAIGAGACALISLAMIPFLQPAEPTDPAAP